METILEVEEETLTTTVYNDTINQLVVGIRKFMNTEYTEIWKISDFLLDIANLVSSEKAIEIHKLHADISPNSQRTVVRTEVAEQLVLVVEDIALT